MRKYLLLLLIIPYCFCFSNSLEDPNFSNIYNVFKDYPSEILEQKGGEYLNNNTLNSSLICFTIISNRYIDKMSLDKKQQCARAYNNLGFIYFFYSNYSKAYTNLLNAQGICEEINYDSLLNSVYSNISYVFYCYNDFARGGEYIEKSYEWSLKTKDWNNLLITFMNMVSVSFIDNTLESRQNRLHEFKTLDIPSDDLYNCALYTCNGMLNILDKDYEQAITNFEKTIEYTENLWMPERYVYASYSNIAKTYSLMKKYDLAIEYTKKAETIALENDLLDLTADAYESLAS